jgi:hypothetical protein
MFEHFETWTIYFPFGLILCDILAQTLIRLVEYSYQ